MKTVTAQELLILDKARFDTAYYKWAENAADYKWWEDEYDCFKEKCNALSITVTDITFSGFCSQGDGAAFGGRVDLTALMEREGLDVQYPALYIGVKNDGSYARIHITRSNNMRCGEYEMYANQTAPDGVFSGLDQEAWEDLVDEQDRDAGLEYAALTACQKLADQLYRDLEAEYEHMTSKESFIESCECNDVTFEIETEEVPS